MQSHVAIQGVEGHMGRLGRSLSMLFKGGLPVRDGNKIILIFNVFGVPQEVSV